MSRLVIPARKGARLAAGGLRPDGYTERVAKYVPVEVIGAYTFFINVSGEGIGPNEIPSGDTLFVTGSIFLICLVVTPFYFLKSFKNHPKIVKQYHAVIATIAFTIWAYSISASVLGGWHVSYLAAALLVGFSLVAGLFQPTLENE